MQASKYVHRLIIQTYTMGIYWYNKFDYTAKVLKFFVRYHVLWSSQQPQQWNPNPATTAIINLQLQLQLQLGAKPNRAHMCTLYGHGPCFKFPICKWQPRSGSCPHSLLLILFFAETSNNLLWLQIVAKAINDIISAQSGQTNVQPTVRLFKLSSERPYASSITSGCSFNFNLP